MLLFVYDQNRGAFVALPKTVKVHGLTIELDEYLNGMLIEGHDAKVIAHDLTTLSNVSVTEAVIQRKLAGRTRESVTRQLNGVVSAMVYKGAMLGDSKCVDAVLENKLDWDLGDRSDQPDFIQITLPKGYKPKSVGAITKKRVEAKPKTKASPKTKTKTKPKVKKRLNY